MRKFSYEHKLSNFFEFACLFLFLLHECTCTWVCVWVCVRGWALAICMLLHVSCGKKKRCTASGVAGTAAANWHFRYCGCGRHNSGLIYYWRTTHKYMYTRICLGLVLLCGRAFLCRCSHCLRRSCLCKYFLDMFIHSFGICKSENISYYYYCCFVFSGLASDNACVGCKWELDFSVSIVKSCREKKICVVKMQIFFLRLGRRSIHWS